MIFSLNFTYPLSFLFLNLDLFPHFFIFSHFEFHGLAFSLALLLEVILLLSVTFLFLSFELAESLLLFSFKTLSLKGSLSFSTLGCSTSEGFLQEVVFRLGGDLVLLEPLVILFEKGESRLDFCDEVPHILFLLIGNRVIHAFFLMFRLSDVAIIKDTKGTIKLT